MKTLALLTVLLAGCLEVPKGPGHECAVSSDCGTGESCWEGLCYGAPPAGTYAATLSAPVIREDLISTEIPFLSLPSNGDLEDMQLETPVTFSGRVEAVCPTTMTNCPTTSIGAQVRITRPSRFAGGPPLRLIALSEADVPRGTDSFSITLPRSLPDDPPYTITIDPEGGGEVPPTHGGKDPAQLVPPNRIEMWIETNVEHQTYLLGQSTVQISGVLKDGLGSPLSKYRVAALGRWDLKSAPTEVSSVHYSTDGTYTIHVSSSVVGPVELVARPYDKQVVAPELRVINVDASYGPQVRNISQPTGLGARLDVAIPIEALTGSDGVKPVAGARVIITGGLDNAFAAGTRVVMNAETVTGDDGIARLSLLDGDALRATYRLRVVPPASSAFGIVYNEEVVLPQPPAVRLPARLKLSGTVVDSGGQPLSDVSVTARRSLRFLWSLDALDQDFLDEIPAATAITPESGHFVVWVDPAVASAWGHYDLYFETPARSHAPNWTISELEIPRIPGQMSLSLETVAIPDAARLHARIVDGSGAPVEGSGLRIFRLADDNAVCREVSNAPAECSDDAKVLGHGESDDAGIVRLTLPRP